MAPRDRFFDYVGTLAHKASDQEKRSLRIEAVQKIEEFWRDRRIRPVIKSERQLARRIRAPDRRPENLRPRINRAVRGNSPHSQQRGRRPLDEQRIHLGFSPRPQKSAALGYLICGQVLPLKPYSVAK